MRKTNRRHKKAKYNPTFKTRWLDTRFGWDKQDDKHKNDPGEIMSKFLNASIFPMAEHPNLWPFPLPKAGAPAFNGGGG
jgi:hypothetical protein